MKTTMIDLMADGDRYYLVGNAFTIKTQIAEAGALWDASRNQWWTSNATLEAVAAVLANAGRLSDASRQFLVQSTPVIGKVVRADKMFYVLWAGLTDGGNEALLLISGDGFHRIWALPKDCRWIKRYEKRNAYGRIDPEGKFPTLSSLQRFKAGRANPRPLGTTG